MVTIKILAIENTQKEMRKKFLNFITKKKKKTRKKRVIQEMRDKNVYGMQKSNSKITKVSPYLSVIKCKWNKFSNQRHQDIIRMNKNTLSKYMLYAVYGNPHQLQRHKQVESKKINKTDKMLSRQTTT